MLQDLARGGEGVSRRDFLAGAAAVAAVGALGGCAQTAAEGESRGAAELGTVSNTRVLRFGVFELALRSPEQVENPFWDVAAVGHFVGPSGRRFRAEGFYDGADVWRVRFSPMELGEWKFEAALRGADGGSRDSAAGHFCAKARRGTAF